jgi:hypothetical protein
MNVGFFERLPSKPDTTGTVFDEKYFEFGQPSLIGLHNATFCSVEQTLCQVDQLKLGQQPSVTMGQRLFFAPKPYVTVLITNAITRAYDHSISLYT